MVKTAALRSENGSHFKVVKNFDDLLGANPYAFLSEDVLLYKNEKGKYVIFTIDPGAT